MVVEFNCSVCGKHRRGYRNRKAPAPRFCSHRCQARWLTKNRRRTANNLPVRRGSKHPRWRSDVPRWKTCEKCGKRFTDVNITTFSKRRFCSRKCGPGHKWASGARHPHWKGGQEARLARGGRARGSKEQRDWSRAVLARDGYKCRECGEETHDLHAHHVLSFRDHPSLRWDVGNGISLCKPCHYRTHRLQKTG